MKQNGQCLKKKKIFRRSKEQVIYTYVIQAIIRKAGLEDTISD